MNVINNCLHSSWLSSDQSSLAEHHNLHLWTFPWNSLNCCSVILISNYPAGLLQYLKLPKKVVWTVKFCMKKGHRNNFILLFPTTCRNTFGNGNETITNPFASCLIQYYHNMYLSTIISSSSATGKQHEVSLFIGFPRESTLNPIVISIHHLLLFSLRSFSWIALFRSTSSAAQRVVVRRVEAVLLLRADLGQCGNRNKVLPLDKASRAPCN